MIVRTEDAPIPQASLFIMAVECETKNPTAQNIIILMERFKHEVCQSFNNINFITFPTYQGNV